MRVVDRLRTAQGWRADLMAAGLGILAAAAMPPLHVVPVLLLAAPGLLLLVGVAPGALAAARRVTGSSVQSRVRLLRTLNGSLKPMWPLLPMPSSTTSMPPARSIAASYSRQ